MCKREHWSEHISTLGDLHDFKSIYELEIHSGKMKRVEVIHKSVAVRAEYIHEHRPAFILS